MTFKHKVTSSYCCSPHRHWMLQGWRQWLTGSSSHLISLLLIRDILVWRWTEKRNKNTEMEQHWTTGYKAPVPLYGVKHTTRQTHVWLVYEHVVSLSGFLCAYLQYTVLHFYWLHVYTCCRGKTAHCVHCKYQLYLYSECNFNSFCGACSSNTEFLDVSRTQYQSDNDKRK